MCNKVVLDETLYGKIDSKGNEFFAVTTEFNNVKVKVLVFPPPVDDEGNFKGVGRLLIEEVEG